jgi:phenylalanyl-tRNA synthetase beta chain
MKVSYKWLQSYITESLPKLDDLVEMLTLHSFEIDGFEKVGDDWMIDVDVLPNRAHDCLSHIGIAKEVSVILNTQFKDFLPFKEIDEKHTALRVAIDDQEVCRRYMGRIIRHIEVKESPAWVKEYLATIGQKSINNIVDATNLVMFDCGQPLHAFDLEKVEGNTVFVQNANDGEEFTTLTGEKVTLDSSMVTIRDAKGALAIAGVKGGKRAEVSSNTKNILLESANFDPIITRKTSRKLAILTDSSKRFENEPTPEFVMKGMNRLTQTILETAKTKDTVIEEIVDVYLHTPQKYTIDISLEDIKSVLGIPIDSTVIADILRRFSFSFTEEKGNFSVKIPDERLDLRIKEDLIEEVVRIYGYEKITAVVPENKRGNKIDKEFYWTTKLRQFFIEHGYSELYTYSFADKGVVQVLNPLASDKGWLRGSVVPRVLEAQKENTRNKDILGLDKVNIFEIGVVFRSDLHEYTEVAFTKGVEKELIDFFGLASKDITFTECENISSFALASVLKLLSDPRDDINFTCREVKKYKPVSPYPFSTRDISVWLPMTSKKTELENIIDKHGKNLLVRTRLVDEFKKDERVSYSYRLVFQSNEKTLTDEEINSIMDKIYTDADKNEGWEVR